MTIGDWILFMNTGDDSYDNNVVAEMLRTEVSHNISLIYNNMYFVEKNGLR